jgi:nucleoside-diphosphate-sugar epimerase
VLGGTVFVGRHIVEAALARGHEVTLFNRGRTHPDLFEGVEELRGDRERLEQIRLEGSERRAEAETRLQMIEAAASRGATWDETNIALHRLSATRENIPLALEAARLEQQAREETDRQLRETQSGTLKAKGES